MRSLRLAGGWLNPDGMTVKEIFYLADPLCPWCWGLSPVIRRIGDEFGDRVAVNLIMSGERVRDDIAELRTGHVDNAALWEQVHESTGQPFNYHLFRHNPLPGDSASATRAVVAVGRIDRGAKFAFFDRLQHELFVAGRDVTDSRVQVEVAGRAGIDEDAFVRELGSPEARRDAAADYQVAGRLRVRQFPSLVVGDEDGLAILAHGYRSAPGIFGTVAKWLDSAPATRP